MVTPALEQAVSGVFSVPGKVLFWVYQRSIGSAIRFLVKSVNRRQMPPQRAREIERQAASSLSAVADSMGALHTSTPRAMEAVSNIAGKVRFYAMFPMYTVFFVSLSLATLPMFVVWYFATGEPPE